MNHRSRKLLDLAHEVTECTNCDRWVAHGCEPAHENGISAGKGQSIKSQDHRHAAMCHPCHAWYDSGSVGMDPSGRYQPTRDDKQGLSSPVRINVDAGFQSHPRCLLEEQLAESGLEETTCKPGTS